ncbi:MAG: gamma-glutamyltransferase family protein [Rhodobacteraceae bacterium]|nr:gamma-glutamyltransferase family protein [Paracoccaceae bacterium]
MRDFQTPGRSLVYAANGLAATSHPHASRAAVEVLRAGGNAVDAGVAAALVLNVCEPAMTGLGGDCFALYAKPDQPLVALNGSGRAPAATDADALYQTHGDSIPLHSAAAVTVPGAIAGLCRLQQDHGRLDRAAVLAPAIDAADSGVPVAPRAAWDWAREKATLQGAARRHFLKDGETPYAAGDLFQAPGQAEALRRIAAEGAAGFYQGEIAADILATLRALGGVHTEEDFAAAINGPEYVQSISTEFAGWEVHVPPPNNHGATALLILDLMSTLDFSNLAPDGADRIHLEAEAAKLAYAARDQLLGDPGTGAGPGAIGAAAPMREPGYVAAMAAAIDRERAHIPHLPDEVGAAQHRDTVYLSVADRDGGLLSLIVSVFHGFGSGHASERFGVPLHNRGAGFTLRPGHPNRLAPGKRPLSTLIPGLSLEQGRPALSHGVMGGQYQAAGQSRLLANLRLFGLDLQTALDMPRSFPENGALALETGHADVVAAQLASLGHQTVWSEKPIGGGQAIAVNHQRGVLIGASDPRKDGCALGY